eukprot:CAMPEP_0175131380 /NCGR_PEP_ID=MMETSP0087-20121206/6510_1 /TAXON_ID=136419 /ORGANISM="Unknown Unknown, Strain D1" /LENGTH=313 /DNA_ID=CAMNT_0016413663 /DNA_START=25 /DNA_END=966 /DNA_ORIENTATION=+
MFISANFTVESALQSLVGGMAIGALAVVRTYCTKGLLTCATPVLWLTTSTTLFAVGLRHFYPSTIFEEIPQTLGWGKVVASGVLVGLGAKLGQGCTSGNGIQGLSALSVASFVHVATFMASGVVTAVVCSDSAELPTTAPTQAPVLPLLAVSLIGIAAQLLRRQPAPSAAVVVATDIAAGCSFAASLVVAQMIHRSKVLGFLDVTNRTFGWDPSLMLVMGGALCVALPDLGLLARASAEVQAWAARPVTPLVVVGGLMFGAGWGLGGWCPGPAMVTCGTLDAKALAFTACMFGSRFAYEGLLQFQAAKPQKSS